MSYQTCLGPGADGEPCGRPTTQKTLSLCQTHDRQRRAGKNLTPIKASPQTRGGKACFGPGYEGEPNGCTNRAMAKGLCPSHRLQEQQGKRLAPLRRIGTLTGDCVFVSDDGARCNKPIKNKLRGLCSGHYNQYRAGKPLVPLKKTGVGISQEEALDRSKKYWGNSFIPEGPCPGVDAPWPGKCAHCKRSVSPRLHKGWRAGPCGYCAHKRVDPAEAEATMLERNLLPLGPYPGKKDAPWPCVCLVCEQQVSPAWNDIRNGQGAGCKCTEHGIQMHQPGILYCVMGMSVTTKVELIKVGIANDRAFNSTKGRLAQHRRQGLDQVLSVRHFDLTSEAKVLEDLWMDFRGTLPKSMWATKTDLQDGYQETVRSAPWILDWTRNELLKSGLRRQDVT